MVMLGLDEPAPGALREARPQHRATNATTSDADTVLEGAQAICSAVPFDDNKQEVFSQQMPFAQSLPPAYSESSSDTLQVNLNVFYCYCLHLYEFFFTVKKCTCSAQTSMF